MTQKQCWAVHLGGGNGAAERRVISKAQGSALGAGAKGVGGVAEESLRA